MCTFNGCMCRNLWDRLTCVYVSESPYYFPGSTLIMISLLVFQATERVGACACACVLWIICWMGKQFSIESNKSALAKKAVFSPPVQAPHTKRSLLALPHCIFVELITYKDTLNSLHSFFFSGCSVQCSSLLYVLKKIQGNATWKSNERNHGERWWRWLQHNGHIMLTPRFHMRG